MVLLPVEAVAGVSKVMTNIHINVISLTKKLNDSGVLLQGSVSPAPS